MNPNAITEGAVEPTWSPDDELLVWTVSRIDGGRRHGIEPDCHVVYAVTTTHFVEQTRRYRASAHQCMELLVAGQSAGTIQRKVELDTIMAVHSDPRSGRLIVKTLNGAHRLDPINDDEADVLREIAAQLEARMPAGGAVLLDPGSLAFQGPERRRNVERDEWLAMRSMANARSEDEVDTAPEPHYESAEAVRVADVPAGGMSPTHPEPAPVEDRQSPTDANEPEVAMHAANQGMVPATDTSAAPTDPEIPESARESVPAQIPSDIDVAGGVPITFVPPGSSRPPSIPAPDRGAPSEVPSDASPPEPSRPAGTGPEHKPAPHHGQRRAPAQPAGAGDPQSFDRRVRRTLPHAGRRREAEPTPSQPETGPLTAATTIAGPSGSDAPADDAAGPSADRRQVDDPAFPSIFDRRRAGPGFRASDDVPNWVSTGPADADGTDDIDPDLRSADRTNPPTLAAPPPTASSSVSEFGESVGFNPDFDVNPFR